MEHSSAIPDVLAQVGPRLKRLRTHRGITLTSVAAKTGISKSTLSRLESGQRKPSLELLLPLADAYQVPLDELVGKLNVPVLGLYGGEDPGIPVANVEQMKAALVNGSPAARRAQFVVYPGAQHAFHADYRPSYQKGSAEDGWKRCLAWLRANGAG